MAEAFLVPFSIYQSLSHALGTAETDVSRVDILRRICACNRINAMGAIYEARHGWLGACFSVAELLTALYWDVLTDDDSLVLGKGHAAAMQYAALAGIGRLPVEDLRRYKEADGPQAHTDIRTPGIAVNSGSLGQALSKAAGLAWQRSGLVFVIIGDGELQEGQNYEALMTISHYRLSNVVVIVDCNGLQSDSEVSAVMALPDPRGLFHSFGFNVASLDGQDMQAVVSALRESRDAPAPTVLLARTAKGAGVSFMSSRTSARRQYAWHGGVPDAAQYREALAELSRQAHIPVLDDSLQHFCNAADGPEREGADSSEPGRDTTQQATGTAFSRSLERLAADTPALRVLDADLEKPCRLALFAVNRPEQFIEVGIAEQDMVSMAGGLALRGLLPVVNTYASFFRRAFEQVYVNATEGTRVIYAGHYAGLCYTTDGKTHQCTGDVAMMRSVPGMLVLYPAFPEELPAMLEWYVKSGRQQPLYLRLHRTPAQRIPLHSPPRFTSDSAQGSAEQARPQPPFSPAVPTCSVRRQRPSITCVRKDARPRLSTA